MALESIDIVQLVHNALMEYVERYKTPIVNVSYDGDHKSCEVIIDVEEHRRHNKSEARQSFVISSTSVEEIPYESDSNRTEAS